MRPDQFSDVSGEPQLVAADFFSVDIIFFKRLSGRKAKYQLRAAPSESWSPRHGMEVR